MARKLVTSFFPSHSSEGSLPPEVTCARRESIESKSHITWNAIYWKRSSRKTSKMCVFISPLKLKQEAKHIPPFASRSHLCRKHVPSTGEEKGSLHATLKHRCAIIKCFLDKARNRKAPRKRREGDSNGKAWLSSTIEQGKATQNSTPRGEKASSRSVGRYPMKRQRVNAQD